MYMGNLYNLEADAEHNRDKKGDILEEWNLEKK
ncbi:hypothetical protein B14911_07563 [Bacillus sp. NRRL B-14911]|nr:hypothetical protein B14911_07563 [Bacillus sp. NRRL B-14911]